MPERQAMCNKQGLDPFAECIIGTADILFSMILEATSAKDSSGSTCRQEN